MRIRLYALPSSHPCAVVEAALRLKGLEYQRTDWLPLTQLALGPLLYGGSTVPGMRIDREKLTGSRTILRRLDELAPEPPLLPADPALSARVLEAERWGDEEFQAVPRRIVDVLFLKDPAAMLSYAGDSKLPLPRSVLKPALPTTARLMARKNRASEESVRADLAALPRQLGKIDAWIAEGLLGGAQPNAADLQIGSSIQLLASYGDVAPLLGGRPCTELARYFPPLPGSIPAGILPADWLPTG
jgi:glutathione S-transferase